jgi:hypothetical protein
VEETSQLASALITVLFAAAMLFAGQQFINYKASRQVFGGAVQIVKSNEETVKLPPVLASTVGFQ